MCDDYDPSSVITSLHMCSCCIYDYEGHEGPSGVVWCGVVWCGVVWCGVVWCGVVWCGVVWCGVVWCGVVKWEGSINGLVLILQELMATHNCQDAFWVGTLKNRDLKV